MVYYFVVVVRSLCRILLFCNPMYHIPPGPSVHGISQARILGVGCHFLLQGIFPTQGSNPLVLHWQADSLPVSHKGSHLVQLYIFFFFKAHKRIHVNWFCWLSQIHRIPKWSLLFFYRKGHKSQRAVLAVIYLFIFPFSLA